MYHCPKLLDLINSMKQSVKPTVTQLATNFPTFYTTQIVLPMFKGAATGPYSGLDISSHSIVTCMSVTIHGIWICNQITELLQLLTTSRDYALTALHTTQITVRYTRFSQSFTALTSRLAVAFNSGHSPSSGFPNCPP
jgi:hypothetical protein